MMMLMLIMMIGLTQSVPGDRCAQNFCEDPNDCPQCDDGEFCVLDSPDTICGGTWYDFFSRFMDMKSKKKSYK